LLASRTVTSSTKPLLEKTMNDSVVLIARILLVQIFLISGFGKLGAGYAGTQAYMASAGIPGALLPFVILLEIGGGIAIVLGFFTRWVALAFAAFCIVSAIFFHLQAGDQGQMINFMKNFAMAGGFLMLFAYGPGAFSIDAKRALPRRA
jgi:putative oxidoreductase